MFNHDHVDSQHNQVNLGDPQTFFNQHTCILKQTAYHIRPDVLALLRSKFSC